MTSPCYICGTGMEEIRLDARDMKPKPCSKCEQIITETAGGRGDDSVMTWGELALFIFDEEDTSNGEIDLGDTERRRVDRVHGPGVEPERIFRRHE